jgi:hypothetical protein
LEKGRKLKRKWKDFFFKKKRKRGRIKQILLEGKKTEMRKITRTKRKIERIEREKKKDG